MNEVSSQRTSWLWLRIIGNLIVCAAILAASVGAIWWINQTEPTAEQITATRKSAALVETITVKRGTYSPRLVVLGTVRPAQSISLSPRVSGQVVEISKTLVPGGMVRKGDQLLRIDPADFENAVSIRKSELEQKEASLEIEQGRQSLAKKELELLESTIDETNRALVLREPQIASIRAEVSAAEAAVKRAELDLQRTEVIAPFDAQVLSRSVDVGSQVSTGDELARLVGIDEYWIMATVPVRSLQWISIPKPNDSGDSAEAEGATDSSADSGSVVRLRDLDSWPSGSERQGRVARMIGALDQETRLARLLVVVRDPLAKDSDDPPLILDTLIETEIEGKPIHDVVRLDRSLVRDGNTVWVMTDEKLQIRDVDIVFRDAQHAYISEGLADDDEVVITTLATVAEGVGLRKVNGDSEDTQSVTKEDSSE